MSRRDGGIVVVVVYAYNDADTIAAAIDSALVQTAPPGAYRVLVVDDGSDDATPSILETYRGERVKTMRLPRRHGVVGGCNAALQMVDAPCFVRLDARDRLEPELIEALLEQRYRSGADLVLTDRWEVAGDGSRVLRELSDPPRLDELIASGILLPTHAVRRLGGYRELFWAHHDLYLRLLEENGGVRIEHIPIPLYSQLAVHDAGVISHLGRAASGWLQLRRQWPAEVLARHGVSYDSGPVAQSVA